MQAQSIRLLVAVRVLLMLWSIAGGIYVLVKPRAVRGDVRSLLKVDITRSMPLVIRFGL